MLRGFGNHLDGDEYAGIVTVFAVLLAVEYAGGFYDLWDVFIGAICLCVGNSFIKTAREKADALYSFVTGCLLGLGIVGIITGTIGIGFLAVGKEQILMKNQYAIEQGRFIAFLILSILLTKKLVTNEKVPNKVK